jgi:hypothetical protein
MGGRALKWKVQQQKFGWWWLENMRTQTLCVRWPMFRVGEILDFQMQLFSLFTVHFPLFLHEKNKTRTVTRRNKVLFLVSNLQLNNRNS